MSVIKEVFEAVKTLADATNSYATIKAGALPADNGISMAIATGSPDTVFKDRGALYSMDIVLNGKHTSQETVLDALADIHQALTQRDTFPDTGEAQITNIETTNIPSYLDRTENQWLYGSSLRVSFYFRR